MKTSFKRLLSLVLVALTLVGCVMPILAVEPGEDCGCDIETMTYYSTKDPGCGDLDYGYDLYFCDEHTRYVARNWIDPTGEHSWKAYSKEPVSCTDTTGYTCEKCENCGEEKNKKPISAGKHQYIYPAGFDCTVGADGVKCGNPNCDNNGGAGYDIPAGSHDFVVDAGNDSCTDVKTGTCSVCGAKDNKLTIVEHKFELKETVAPKCENEPGYMLYQCTSEGCDAGYKVAVVVTGHTFVDNKTTDASCVTQTPGSVGGTHCVYCNEVGTPATITPWAHTPGDKVDAKAAQCKSDGTLESGHHAYYQCTVCEKKFRADKYDANKTYDYNITTTLNHDFGDAYEVTPEDCANDVFRVTAEECKACGYVRTHTDTELTHNGFMKVETESSATCGEWGWIFEICTKCGDGRDRRTEPTGDHKFENATEKAPTCEAPGNPGGLVCKVCKIAKDVTGYNPEDYAQLKHAPKMKDGHPDWTVKENVKPTCTKDGQWICVNGCGKIYGADYDETLAKTGHDFVNAIETVDPLRPQTCMSGGWIEKLCANGCGTNAPNYPMEKAESDPDAHVWEVDQFGNVIWYVRVSPTCVSTGINYKLCTLCGNNDEEMITDMLEHKAVEGSGVVKVPATCGTMGWTQYTCQYKGGHEETVHEFFLQDVAALDHSYTIQVGDPGYSADCDKEGLKDKYLCANCGAVDPDRNGDVIPKLHSTVEVTTKLTFSKISGVWQPIGTFHYVAYKASTCTVDGNEEYVYCDKCGDMFVWNAEETKYEQVDDVVITTDHNYKLVESYPVHCPAKNCEYCGTGNTYCSGNGLDAGETGLYQCEYCDGWKTGVAAAVISNTHTNKHVGYTTKKYDATCWKTGKEVWYCTVEGCDKYNVETQIKILAMKGHTFADPDAVNAGSCTEDAYKTHYCTVCYDAARKYADFPLSKTYNEDVTKTWIYVYDFVAQDGHQNKDGTTLIEGWACNDPAFAEKAFKNWTEEELTCKDCHEYEAFIASHQMSVAVTVPGTCTTPAHTISVCANCETDDTVITGDKDPDNHENLIEKPGKPATFFTNGTKIISCDACDVEDKEVADTNNPVKTGYSIRLEVVGYESGFKAAHSSKLKVNVIVKNVDKTEAIEFKTVSATFTVSDLLIYEGIAYSGNQPSDNQMSLIANAAECESDTTLQDIKVSVVMANAEVLAAGEEVAIATLTFSVGGNRETVGEKFVINQPTAYDIKQSATRTYKGIVSATQIKGETQKLGNFELNTEAGPDYAVGEDDLLVLSELVFETIDEETLASIKNIEAGDINKNGEFDTEDLYLLQQYYVGKITYEQLCDAGKPEQDNK